ncbi:MAG TPA: hypothetical protein VH914_04895 [Acidimicrobiia bacterium]|nr:hypothetical protein [Acidimicrobiia bacterium]
MSWLTAAGAVASAAPGPGTFTKITTPSGTTTFDLGGGTNEFTVSGQASLDVTSVDIDCIYTTLDGTRSVAALAGGAPVSPGGTFSVAVDYTHPAVNCRLRAIPTGTDATTAYLGSYAGPILYTDAFVPLGNGSTEYGYSAFAEESDGISLLQDAGACGVGFMATVATPGMELQGTDTGGCKFALPARFPDPNATASAIKVNGHNAYLPSGVHDFLVGTLALPVAQSTLTTTSTIAGDGDVTITESARLMRCSVSDAYPPTPTSCPSIVSTGVKFERVSQVVRGAHQVAVRDTFSSTDGAAHTLTLDYQQTVHQPQTGAAGYVFPGHGSAFAAAAPDEVVSGLGTKAASMLVRSDLYSTNGDPSADTLALTWSRAPDDITFAHFAASEFAMPYALTVPAGDSVSLGFAESEDILTPAARSLGNLASGDMINAPTITSPSDGAVLGAMKTTVRGTLTAGANGLPVSVVVAGHDATITKTSATRATYKVTFTESVGTHTLNATATDVAGNAKASASITVQNQ